MEEPEIHKSFEVLLGKIHPEKRQNMSDALPLVSVIIPVYNMKDFIGETIESVLNSDYPNFEIVIVDDGSSDNSELVCTKYADEYDNIRFFRQKNAGASAARNNAINHAKGDYILPLDGDDKLSANYISEAVKAFNNNPEIKIVGSEAEFFGDREGKWELPEFSIRQLARRNQMNCSSMYRRSDWEKVGGYCEEIKGREDWDFWISLLKTGGDFYRLPIVGLYYRIRKNSKRVKARKWKHEIIDKLNERHPEFFLKHLGGPLRYFREMSRFINFFYKK